MAEIRYTTDHEWIRQEDDGHVVVGITDYAQGQLGDVVFVELPETGRALTKGDEAAVVESVKAAAEVYAPIDGEVVAVNESLEAEPGLVNSTAEDRGWFFRMRVADPQQLQGLMDRAAYDALIADES